MALRKICEKMHKKLEHLSLFLGVLGKGVSSGQRDLEYCLVARQSLLMRALNCTARGSAVSQSDKSRNGGTR